MLRKHLQGLLPLLCAQLRQLQDDLPVSRDKLGGEMLAPHPPLLFLGMGQGLGSAQQPEQRPFLFPASSLGLPVHPWGGDISVPALVGSGAGGSQQDRRTEPQTGRQKHGES